MVIYAADVVKRINKGLIPEDVFLHIDNALGSIDLTKDLNLFDIIQLNVPKGTSLVYYRLRKGKYRAIFYIEDNDTLPFPNPAPPAHPPPPTVFIEGGIIAQSPPPQGQA